MIRSLFILIQIILFKNSSDQTGYKQTQFLLTGKTCLSIVSQVIMCTSSVLFELHILPQLPTYVLDLFLLIRYALTHYTLLLTRRNYTASATYQ